MVRVLPCARLLLFLPCTLIPSKGQDLLDPECTIYIRQHEHSHLIQDRRRPSNGSRTRQQLVAVAGGSPPLWTAAVAPSPEGIAVVWQEAGSIFMRRFGHDCRSKGYPCVVTSTRNIRARSPGWGPAHHTHGSLLDEAKALSNAAAQGGMPTGASAREPREPTAAGTSSPSPQSELQPDIEPELTFRDAAALKEGRTAVVWTRDGDVWVSIVSDEVGPPVRASGDGRFERTDVMVTATPDGQGFIVAWSSFGQDGDGWGIFARVFDNQGKPDGSEHLVNIGSQGSQQHPQLTACISGSAGPAVWALWGNGTGNASHELFMRRLASGGSWAPDQELRVTGRQPQSAASSPVLSSSTLMCATGSSTEDPTVVWAVGEPGKDRRVNWRTVADIQQGVPINDTRSFLVPAQPTRQFLKHNNRSRPASNPDSNRRTQDSATFSGNVGAHGSRGTFLLRAEGDVLAVAAEDERGGVSVQLFDMMPSSPYPTHQMMTVGSSLQQIAYDVTVDQALITCWSHLSGLSCERRHLQALMEQEAEPIAWWFAIVVFVILFWCRHEFMSNDVASSRQVHPLRSSHAAVALRDLRTRMHFERVAEACHASPAVPRSVWKLRQQAKFI